MGVAGARPMKPLAVLIPAFNEEAVVSRAIFSAYLSGAVPDDVYVVDDGSTDRTAEIAWHMNAQVLSTQNHGKAAAIRVGLQLLEGKYERVAILDADSAVSEGYITEMRKAAAKHPDAAVLCGAPRSLPHNWLTAYRAVEYAISLGIYREAQSLFRAITVAPGCASVYKVAVLASLDFTGGTLVEDMDFTIQLHRLGKEIRYVPDAIVYTQDPRTLRDYIGQIDRWYTGTWQVVRLRRLGKHIQPIDIEILWLLSEGLLFAGIIPLIPLLVYLFPIPTLIGLALDQLLLFSFSLIVARREQRLDVVWAFPLFLIPRVLSSVRFLWAFMVSRRFRSFTWYSVRRYT